MGLTHYPILTSQTLPYTAIDSMNKACPVAGKIQQRPLASSQALAKPIRSTKTGLVQCGTQSLANVQTLIALGAAVAFLFTLSAIRKSKTRGSDRTPK